MRGTLGKEALTEAGRSRGAVHCRTVTLKTKPSMSKIPMKHCLPCIGRMTSQTGGGSFISIVNSACSAQAAGVPSNRTHIAVCKKARGSGGNADAATDIGSENNLPEQEDRIRRRPTHIRVTSVINVFVTGVMYRCFLSLPSPISSTRLVPMDVRHVLSHVEKQVN